jgi:hypothetical protein
MAEETIKRPGHRFSKGHPHYPRKPKERTVRSAIETARDMGFDAVKLMLDIIATGSIPEPDGTRTAVTLQDRIRLLREVSQYLIPRPTTMVSTAINHHHAHIDMTAIMMDPQLAEAAQTLALAMAQQDVPDFGTDSRTYNAGD